MGKAFTPERLVSIRRMRKARRLYKQMPLFAFEILREEYPNYTREQFLDDLRYRTKAKRKKKKTTLTRYGRYARMVDLLHLYQQTGNNEYAIQAQRLRKRMTKPYRVRVKIGGQSWEYGVEATVPIHEVEQLTADLSTCTTIEQADEMMRRFWEMAQYK